jgi:hypothetical protein
MKMKKVVMVLVSVLCVLLTLRRPAYAYLDPGSGSMLLQLVLGGVAGITVIVKLYWRRFLTLLRVRRGEQACPKTAAPEANAELETPSVEQQRV